MEPPTTIPWAFNFACPACILQWCLILKVFRLLRSLRPLRVINRAPGLKLVVQTLITSLKPIGNIVLICCTFFIIFGILGVQVFLSFYFIHSSTQLRACQEAILIPISIFSLVLIVSYENWINCADQILKETCGKQVKLIARCHLFRRGVEMWDIS